MSTFFKIGLALLFLVVTPSALACVCEKTPSTSAAFKDADAVFSARFVGAEYRKGIVDGLRRIMDARDGKKTDYEVLVLKFEVEHWWKGKPSKELVLITSTTRDGDGKTTSSDCEYKFSEGDHYLVYAYRGEGGLETSLCTRTKLLADAQGDLKVLEKTKPPKS